MGDVLRNVPSDVNIGELVSYVLTDCGPLDDGAAAEGVADLGVVVGSSVTVDSDSDVSVVACCDG